jgi:HlyD family secretion protein
LANAGVEYRRHEQLFAAGAISESLFDSKRLAVETVFQQMKEAEAVLAEIKQTSRQEIEAARTTLTKLQRAGSKEIEEAQVRLRKLQETGEEQLKEAIANLREIETTKQEQITEAIANLTRIQRTGRSQLSEEQVTLAKLQDTGAEQLREARVKREQLEKTGLEELNEARVARVRIQATGEQQIKEAESTLQSLAEVRTVDVQAAKAEVDRALAQVEEAQARLEEAYVRSPVAGRVMEVHTRPGETIGDNGIVEIGQTEQMYAIAEVYETDIQRVRLGQRATITSDAFEGELQGRVDRIGVQIGKKDVLDTDPTADVDVRVVEVHIRLHPEDSRRVADLTNLQVQVTIATGKADN